MTMLEVIAHRRDGLGNSAEELDLVARGAAFGDVPDYQLAAWLMAAYLRPLSARETADLTRAMAASGERLDLSALPKPRLDKHSTGGVGDKTSIVLMPLLSACGATVVKMSGRGLGITGGTVDKLASVPGFRLDLTPQEMIAQAASIGIALTGQTAALAPADKALYALRDATATVGSLPLIVSSILSKKLAAGAENVVLDVKCGSGAFMPDLNRAKELANALKEIGVLCGLNVRPAITDMDQPLGSAIGNALEVKEAIAVLQRRARGRFRELCLDLAGLALEACGLVESRWEGRSRAEEALETRAAEHKARQWFEAQGGSLVPFESDDWCLAPKVLMRTHAGADGWVARVDARAVGQAVVDLGGGRKRKEDAIAPDVGVELFVEVGTRVEPGDRLFQIHALDGAAASRAADTLEAAIEVVREEVAPRPWLLEVW